MNFMADFCVKIFFRSLLIFCLLAYFHCQAQDLIPFRKDRLWGFKDANGVVRIQPQFQYASKFADGTAIVAKHDSLGAIDENNKLIVPFQHQFLRQLDSSEFLFGHRAKYFGEYMMGVITAAKQVKIPAEYSHIYKRNNRYVVMQQQDSIIAKDAAGDVRAMRTFYGLFDTDGRMLIPCKYDYLSWLNDSLIVLSDISSHNRQALFNKSGKQLTGFEYMVFGKPADNMIKARIGDKYGFVDHSGRVAIPIQFEYCEDFTAGFAMIRRNEKWGAINKAGKVIIEPKFEYQQVKALLEKNGK
jgi:hypothetical protein